MSQPQSHHAGRRPLVVVGVDGSPRSVPVLEWAAAHARAVDAEVRVVTAWAFPEVPGYRPTRVEADLSAALEKVVAGLVARTLTGVPTENVVQEDGAARLLLKHAREADLLVLGNRGHDLGRDDVERLGNVTQACLLKAPCPVVVVPVGDAPAAL